MHPNPVFHTESDTANLAYARARGFGTLTVCGGDGPLLSHVPFVLDETGVTAALHLLRSNPIARALRGTDLPCKIAVTGPHSYVSPDWYGIDDQVPTWNYVAVHLTGTLSLRPQEELRALLDRQSAQFEERLAPKTPWTADKMTGDTLERMMRSIVPCRVTVTGVDGTWKLNQNKPDEVRLRAADAVEAHGIGTDLAALAILMREA
ncbi:FMN-binding negative transcriptional regulator [Sulfitobacter sp. D35]|uniref:FMN-binding negative transcriptional regulator n=1 Tax=Sulfitobacter sp. D35 TaxID=3083252 RepID=UPI00296ED179|nr:FMN-binding negative transcriptional regulator [Sulfitobacter sp. D35]MDW4498236.1 FMN-binding negative transcriptional regulator [Sulfitobacter sp. D35]